MNSEDKQGQQRQARTYKDNKGNRDRNKDKDKDKDKDNNKDKSKDKNKDKSKGKDKDKNWNRSRNIFAYRSWRRRRSRNRNTSKDSKEKDSRVNKVNGDTREDNTVEDNLQFQDEDSRTCERINKSSRPNGRWSPLKGTSAERNCGTTCLRNSRMNSHSQPLAPSQEI